MNNSPTTPGRMIGERPCPVLYGYGTPQAPPQQTNSASGWTLTPADTVTASNATRKALALIAGTTIALVEVWRDLRT